MNPRQAAPTATRRLANTPPLCNKPLLPKKERSAAPERGRSSGVEHNLAKVGVGRSNRLARSSFVGRQRRLDSGAFVVVPAFTGRALQVFQPGAAARSDAQVYKSMVGALPEGIAAGDYATAAEDKPALAVTDSTSKGWGGNDLSALPRHCDGLVVGSLAGAPTPAAVGSCRLPAAHEFSDDATLFAALQAGKVTAAWTTTADPNVTADLVVLTDGKGALVQAENVVPLYRRNELTDRQLLAVNEVAGVLDTAALVEMRRQVIAGADPQVVADGWLGEHPLGR